MANLDDIDIRPLKAEDYEGIVSVLCDALPRDPSIIACEADVLGDLAPSFPRYLSSAKEGLSYGAFDKRTGELIGIRMVSLITKDDPVVNGKLSYAENDPSTRKLVTMEWTRRTLMDSFGRDWFEYYKTDVLVRLYHLCVKTTHARRGIGKRLFEEALLNLKSKGYRCITGMVTSNYSRSVFERTGFKTVATFKFGDFVKDGEKVFTKDTGEHNLVTFHVKTF